MSNKPRPDQSLQNDPTYQRYLRTEITLNKRLGSLQSNINYYKRMCDKDPNTEIDSDKINAMFDEIDDIKWAKECIKSCKSVYVRLKKEGKIE